MYTVEKLTRWNPMLSCPVAPCSVNNDFTQFCNIFDCLWHCACASQSACLVMGYCVTMKALAAAAFGSQWSDNMIMLYEVILWVCYALIMVMLWLLPWLLHQPGDRLCFGCCASQERINLSVAPIAPCIFFQPLSSSLA